MRKAFLSFKKFTTGGISVLFLIVQKDICLIPTEKHCKKGCNHDRSEEEWVMWADLAVSGLQHH